MLAVRAAHLAADVFPGGKLYVDLLDTASLRGGAVGGSGRRDGALVDTSLVESPEPDRFQVPKLIWLFAKELAIG